MEYLTLLASVVLRINLLVSSRFGEALRDLQERLDSKNFYAFNPSFDKQARQQVSAQGTKEALADSQ